MEKKKIWFEGAESIETSLTEVKNSLNDVSYFFVALINRMPSMMEVRLLEKGNDFVTIQTNEGVMKRTQISISSSTNQVTLTFDEEYQAGTTITTNANFIHEFISEGNGVRHHMTINALKATGITGFFYRNFGSKNIGKAFLQAHKSYFDQ